MENSFQFPKPKVWNIMYNFYNLELIVNTWSACNCINNIQTRHCSRTWFGSWIRWILNVSEILKRNKNALKLIYSEKATKFLKKSPNFIWSYLVSSKNGRFSLKGMCNRKYEDRNKGGFTSFWNTRQMKFSANAWFGIFWNLTKFELI